jgi:AcrR family transcriptional regulator
MPEKKTLRRPAAPPAELNRDEIVAAALRVIDRVGVDAFTMRGLADELRFSTMAAYRHVSNKEELLFMAVDSVLEQVEVPSRDLPWSARFEGVAHAVWEAIEPHPWILGFLSSRDQKPVANLERIFSELHDILDEAGLDAVEARMTITMAWTFTLGLLSWTREPGPYLEFGIDMIMSGLQARSRRNQGARRKPR